MIEVEIKIVVQDPDAIHKQLLNKGFVKTSVIRETDQYFNRPERDFRSTDEALRIRTSENLETGISSSAITYKGPKKDRISMTREEQETQVENGMVLKRILEHLGFVPVMPVRKVRSYYCKDHMHACADSVEGLGDFLELEILTESEADREPALKQMYQMLTELGLDPNKTIRTSYLSMLEETR